MANKSLGSLYVDIIAKTEKLEGDMARVKSIMTNAGQATNAAGKEAASAFKSFQLFNSFQGRGMTGITLDMMAFGMATRAVVQEIMHVYQNIDKIPGMSPEAVNSVREFKENWKEIRDSIDRVIGSAMGGLFQFGKMVGTGAAMMLGYGNGEESIMPTNLDKQKLAEDPAYYDKVRAAVTALSEARKQAVAGMQTQAMRADELNRQAAQYLAANTAHGGANTDSLTRIQRETEALKLQGEASRIVADMSRRTFAYRREEDVENQQARIAELSQLEKMKELKKLMAEEESYLKIRTPATAAVPLTAQEAQSVLQHYPKFLAYLKEFNAENQKIASSSKVMTAVFVDGMGDMNVAVRQLVTGASNDFDKLLKTLADKIIDTFASLAVINPLLNVVFGSMPGFNLLPALFGAGAKKAAGGPGSGWTMVGEEGPEMVNLRSGSTVIPAWQTRQAMGGGGNVYQIDARGAQAGVAEEIKGMLLALAGPGVTEERSLAAYHNAEWRRNN